MSVRILKLPQARYYLRAARFGIQALADRRPLGAEFLFMCVGILASLRTVQFALLNHDSKLSPSHQAAIARWRARTPIDGPEMGFIKESRDRILKGGAFAAYATRSESGIGEGENYEITSEDYEAVYYVDGKRRDLIADMWAAADWCESQLADLDNEVPGIEFPDEDDDIDLAAFEESLREQGGASQG